MWVWACLKHKNNFHNWISVGEMHPGSCSLFLSSCFNVSRLLAALICYQTLNRYFLPQLFISSYCRLSYRSKPESGFLCGTPRRLMFVFSLLVSESVWRRRRWWRGVELRELSLGIKGQDPNRADRLDDEGEMIGREKAPAPPQLRPDPFGRFSLRGADCATRRQN